MRADASDLLAARFAAIRDDSDTRDWADVLRRSSAGRITRRINRPVALVALIAAAVIVPATIAFGGTIRDFFFGTPAPSSIKQAFRQNQAAMQMMQRWQREHGRAVPASARLHIDAAKAHGVLAAKTPDGLLLLWAAPAGDGRQCWIVGFAADQINHKRATGSLGTCETAAPPPSKIDWNYGWSRAHPTLKVLSGRLYVDATTLLVDVGQKQPRPIPVVDGYFAAAFPRSTHIPTKLTAIDASGQVVATATR